MFKRGEEVGITAYITWVNIAPFHGNNVMIVATARLPTVEYDKSLQKPKSSSLSGTTVAQRRIDSVRLTITLTGGTAWIRKFLVVRSGVECDNLKAADKARGRLVTWLALPAIGDQSSYIVIMRSKTYSV
ncbi:hypothetical protein F5146DRAFT_1005337 [Armillaria mellea]|nr:hypothetical protein F5146DRAFT_1005337 [Armillaria mellea]